MFELKQIEQVIVQECTGDVGHLCRRGSVIAQQEIDARGSVYDGNLVHQLIAGEEPSTYSTVNFPIRTERTVEGMEPIIKEGVGFLLTLDVRIEISDCGRIHIQHGRHHTLMPPPGEIVDQSVKAKTFTKRKHERLVGVDVQAPVLTAMVVYQFIDPSHS